MSELPVAPLTSKQISLVSPSTTLQDCILTLTLSDLPEASDYTAEKEESVSLDKRWQEGKEAIRGHANEETLSAAHFVRHSSPEESSNHHSQVHNAA